MQYFCTNNKLNLPVHYYFDDGSAQTILCALFCNMCVEDMEGQIQHAL